MSGSEAVELWLGRADAQVVLTCEHASERFPEPWRWLDQDGWLRGTHWSHDLGAAELTRELAARLGAPAVLSRFSRLLADPNRPEGDPTLFRSRAEGQPVAINHDLSAEEKERRLDQLYRPYHRAVDRLVGESQATVVFAVHSFTPDYEGQTRDLELGILFDHDEGPAGALAQHLAASLGAHVALNEPYSGKEGLIFSASHHARAHGRVALEIEVRQDLLADAAYLERLAAALAPALRRVKSGRGRCR